MSIILLNFGAVCTIQHFRYGNWDSEKLKGIYLAGSCGVPLFIHIKTAWYIEARLGSGETWRHIWIQDYTRGKFMFFRLHQMPTRLVCNVLFCSPQIEKKCFKTLFYRTRSHDRNYTFYLFCFVLFCCFASLESSFLLSVTNFIFKNLHIFTIESLENI